MMKEKQSQKLCISPTTTASNDERETPRWKAVHQSTTTASNDKKRTTQNDCEPRPQGCLSMTTDVVNIKEPQDLQPLPSLPTIDLNPEPSLTLTISSSASASRSNP